MNKKAFALIFAGLVLGILAGVLYITDRWKVERQSSPPQVGSLAADFNINDIQGNPFSLSGKKGTPLVINFWTTWCVPCRVEMPMLNQYAQKYGKQVEFVGINSQEDLSSVQRFLKETPIQFPILLDLDGQITDLYYVDAFPTTLFINSEGIIEYIHLGQMDEEILQNGLKKIGVKP